VTELNSKEAVKAIMPSPSKSKKEAVCNSIKVFTNNYFNNGERDYKFERVFQEQES
jgi:hypothetical protein